MGNPDHIDLRSWERQGWFEKEQEKIKNYKSRCKAKKGTKKKPPLPAAKPECFHGPYSEAHHILPGTSIKESGEDYAAGDADVKRYLEEVKWVTKWNINDKPNLIGLPTFLSFEIYYRAQRGEGVPARELVALYKKYTALIQDRCPGFRAARKKFLEAGAPSPEGLPIHNPTSYGHKKYDEEVKTLVFDQVWTPLAKKGAKHEARTGDVASALKKLIDVCLSTHLLRGEVKTGQKDTIWEKKKSGWHPPYCMMDGVPDPL